MKLSDLTAGMIIYAGASFTCLAEGPHTVHVDDGGELFIPCKAGYHYLDKQENEKGELVGLSLEPFE